MAQRCTYSYRVRFNGGKFIHCRWIERGFRQCYIHFWRRSDFPNSLSIHVRPILQFIMDYSSLPNDPDHPAGADPWQSSPQPTRTSFPQPESAREPDSPTGKHPPLTPEPQHQEERDGSDQESPNASSYEEPFPKANGTGRIPSRPDTASDIRFQGPPLTEEELRQQQLYQQRQNERYQQTIHAQQHARSPGPQRYHPGARTGQRQPPQYKLQAKITGLERTGKKDPAITFDVHVSLW